MNQTNQIDYDNQLTILLGEGGNSAILVGEESVLVVDTKMLGGASKLYELVMQKANGKKIILVNTHLHGDHTMGNQKYKDATIYAGNYSLDVWKKENGDQAIPTNWVKDQEVLTIGDETVIIKNLGQAHTFSDVVVFFKKRKILFMGDLLTNGFHPFFKKENGTIAEQYAVKQKAALEEFQPTKIVPGHGPMGGMELVKEFQQYFDDIKAVALGKMNRELVEEKYHDWPGFLHMSGIGPSIRFYKEELGQSQ